MHAWSGTGCDQRLWEHTRTHTHTHTHTHARRAAGRHGPGPNVQHTLLPLAETCAPCRLLQALVPQHMEAHPGLGQTVAAQTRRVPVARWVSSGDPKRHDPTGDSATAQVAAAAGEDRTHDLRIMRPTRCQLRYCRPDSAAGQRQCLSIRLRPNCSCARVCRGWVRSETVGTRAHTHTHTRAARCGQTWAWPQRAAYPAATCRDP